MILNDLALLINNFISNLYAHGIRFYQIIIGMFIFDYLVYQICYMLKVAKYRR